jgi:DNA-binding NtrC family response regulator
MKNNNPRVLIIEGHDVLRVMLFTILRHQPLDVDTAESADVAMAKIEGCDYALILIDMNLQNADAGAFLDRFREARPDAKTFIIAVRDPNREAVVDPTIVSAVLNKPLEIDMLAEVVRECAVVVPPPDDPLPCPPAESDVRIAFDRGPSTAN